MKLDTVLTAVNDNPLYIGFVPYFIRMWKLLYPDVNVKIVLVAEYIPENLKEYNDNLILFKPIEGISTAFTSQYIRLLYPNLLGCTNGVLITDMDIVPMNRTYYTYNIKDIDDDKFVYYRENICRDHDEIAMCYNIALPGTWAEIFNINTIEDVTQRLKDVYSKITYGDVHGGDGWSTDQKDLLMCVEMWNNKTNNFVTLKETDTNFKRLDRWGFPNIQTLTETIKSGTYCDYHCLRPYDMYKDINEYVFETLKSSISKPERD